MNVGVIRLKKVENKEMIEKKIKRKEEMISKLKKRADKLANEERAL